MKIAAAASALEDSHAGLDDVIARCIADLQGLKPHLAFFTLTNPFEHDAAEFAAAIRERTGVETLFGCAGEGVIGPGEEIERTAGMALWLAHLPAVRIRAYHIHPNDLEAVESHAELEKLMRAPAAEKPAFLLLADPFFTPYCNGMNRGTGLLDALAHAYPDSPVVGGMASGARGEGQSVLMLNDDVFNEGAVCVALSGNVRVAPVVSQGCRPVGDPFIITAAERNVIHQLGGKPALGVLNEVYQSAPPRDRQLLSHGVFIGRAISEYRDRDSRGDFLIRNVIGASQDSQSVIIADLARVGTTVQFHVRDADSADEDLRHLLAAHRSRPAGGLMFSCNGRGTRMFPDVGHDVGVVQNVLGNLPVAGLFCAGEIGPVGGQAFVHGHTASIALLHPRDPEPAA